MTFGYPKPGTTWKGLTVEEIDTTNDQDYRIVMSDGQRLTYMERLVNYSH